MKVGVTLSAVPQTTVPNVTLYSSSTLSLNTWYHVAFTRVGTNGTLWIDGVSNATTTSIPSNLTNGARALYIAYEDRGASIQVQNLFQGYISNLRIVKGTAVYTSTFTPSTSALTAITNTQLLLLTNNYSVVNSTPTPLPVTINGNTTISTAQYPTGMTRSIYFDGTGDYLTIPNNSVFQLGSGDFTIENWVNFSSLPASNNISSMVGLWDGTPYTKFSYLTTLFNNAGTYQLRFFYSTNGISASNISVNWTPSLNTWYHIAFVRSSNSLYIFVNGTQIGSTGSLTATLFASTQYLIIGSASTTEHPLNGYLSNVRLVKGTAVYTANFTTPSAPLSINISVPNNVTNAIYGVNQLA